MNALSSVLAAVLLAAGGVLAGLSLFLGAPLFGGGAALFQVPLAVAVLCLLVGTVLTARRAAAWSRTGRLAAECALWVAAAVGVQFLAVRIPTVIDVSSTQRNTLSDKSAQVARALKEPITLRAAMARDDRAFVELSALVDRYRVFTDQLTLERSEQRASLGEPNAVLLRVVDGNERRAPMRIVAGAPDHEELLTNALVALTSETPLRAYFVAGHGEAELLDELPGGLSRLREALAVEGIEPVSLPLDRLEQVPSDAALVVEIGATQPLDDGCKAKLQRYVDGGGRALLLLEPGVDTGLDGLVGGYGVFVGPGLVIDESALSGLAGGPETATGTQLEHRHPVTRSLGDALTHFPRARPLADSPGTEARVTPLVQAGADAYTELDAAGSGGAWVHDADELGGPIPLLMASEQGHTRLVVGGDSSFCANRGLGFGANKDLAVNAVLWLAEREDKIAIRPKGRGGALLLLTPSGRDRLAWVLLYGLPVLLVALGAGVRAWRRR